MKKIFAVSLLTAAVFHNAQSLGNSPYAAYGIGDVKYDNTVDISAMGGISTAYINDFNNKFNFQNPAANTNFGITSFTVEGTNEHNYYRSDYSNMKSTKHSTYLSNISLAFPISQKVKFGIDYQPYSSKSYSALITENLSDETVKGNLFTGKGTLSLVQTAVSYNLSPSFALGLKGNFYFGKLHDLQELTYSDADLISGYDTTHKISSFNFTAGSTYQKKFEDDKKLTLGATYSFGSTGKMQSKYINSTYYYTGNEQKSYETIIDQSNSNSKNLLPQEGSLGIGYGDEGKWFLSTQYNFKKGEEISFLGKDFKYQNSSKISAGGWYLPNYNNFRNYFSRVIYRFGGYYEKGNLRLTPLNSTSATNINEYALTAGATFPFANNNINRMSSLDLAFEVGKRGTLDNNLIRQTFFNIKIGLNFADKWFQKRQYD